MESPVRKMQKRNDYNRHKLFRKIKRRRKAAVEQQSKAAEKELKRRLKWTAPKFEDGKDTAIYPTLIDTNYDQYRAQQLGYGPADNGHYPSRDRITGDILKYPQHPTFLKALLDDARLLYLPTKDRKKGRSRTDTWDGNENILNNVNYFDHSYHGLSRFEKGKKGQRLQLDPETQRLMDIQSKQGMSGSDPVGEEFVKVYSGSKAFNTLGNLIRAYRFKNAAEAYRAYRNGGFSRGVSKHIVEHNPFMSDPNPATALISPVLNAYARLQSNPVLNLILP